VAKDSSTAAPGGQPESSANGSLSTPAPGSDQDASGRTRSQTGQHRRRHHAPPAGPNPPPA
jgi:hypothetical protein